MHGASTDQLTHEASRYKCLAEAVIIQAIKDATYLLGHDKHFTQTGHLYSVTASAEAASKFLLTDSSMFPFWCHVAGLIPEEVRRQLARKLGWKRTFKLIRSLNRYRKSDGSLR